MNPKRIFKENRQFFKNLGYRFLHHSEYDYKEFEHIQVKQRAGRGRNTTYNDCLIMFDTETSKKNPDIVGENHVVAWTISVRAYGLNICTLWGHKPSTLVETINKMHTAMPGQDMILYCHNLSYDWVFVRQYFFQMFKYPEKQLNTKVHYPINIQFENGIILKDSLILAQRKLEKWAKDLNVEHQKAVGCWDYDIIRNQNEKYSESELKYIENDTLSGVECLDATMQSLGKRVASMPYTATGIPREEVRKRGKENRAHSRFLSLVGNYEEQIINELTYHGGFTHGNRHYINTTIDSSFAPEGTKGKDFASSYPFNLLRKIYPVESFHPYKDCKIKDILELSTEYCCMFKMIMIKPRLRDDFQPMPVLQYSKCTKIINPVLDNGRVLTCEYCEIYLTEYDLMVIDEQYIMDGHICVGVRVAEKGYLPRWFTDYVFELFQAKTTLKGGDPVLYSIAKAKLNSLYGLCVQKPVKDLIQEEYASGDYVTTSQDFEEEFEKYKKRANSILPYVWGIYCTASAMKSLFDLGKCVDYENGGDWLYSDTDSCYGTLWDEKKVEEYNNNCKKELIANGYGAVIHNNREYWLGIAESDEEMHYSEFRYQGSKRYCGRSVVDGKLHITVAGVPKTGSECLNDDINNFAPNLIFSGNITGKKTHTYFYNEMYVDSNGNETADSIDLSACDYLLDSINVVDWEKIFEEEIQIQVYEEY